MKKVVLFSLFTFSMATFSGVAHADLTAAKAEANGNLDKRIATLQEAKNCINAAPTAEDIKKCRAEVKEDHMALRKENLERREARVKDRLQKIEAKKAE